MECGMLCGTQHYHFDHKVVSIYSISHTTVGNQLTSGACTIAPIVIAETSGNGESKATKENILNR